MSKEKKKKETSTLKKVLRYIKKYYFLLALSIFVALIHVATTLYIPIVVGNTIDTIVGPGNVAFDIIGKSLVLILAVAVLGALSQWIMHTINNKITFRVVQDIRNEAFEKLQHLPLRYIDSKAYGDIVSRIIADADQFADGLLMGFSQLFTGVVTIGFTLFFMFYINGWIALVVVLLTPISLFVARFIAKKTYHMFKAQSETRGEQTAYIEEIIANQQVVKAFHREEKCIEKFRDINERLEKCSMQAIFYSSLTNPVTRFINSIVYAGVGVAGGIGVIYNLLTVGEFSCFLSYANQYTKPFNEISGVITELQNALACAGRVFELLDEQEEIEEDTAKDISNVKGCVELEKVYFSYVADKKLVEDFNLKAEPGQRIAIVGPTGCGKTTLINLLMRFYDVNSGSIRVDGNDINHVSGKSLRSNYGMVLQDTWLKTGTIFENIKMGKPEASMEEVIAAAKASHAHNFIKRMENGYDTVIGENGTSLSQGEKQLLCIARVMLSLPPMLILDEATSSIDTRTEVKIQEAFSRMMKGRTSFIVAHRLCTIREADVILVMNNGNIVEQGSHEELIEKKGFYANLYNSQFAKV